MPQPRLILGFTLALAGCIADQAPTVVMPDAMLARGASPQSTNGRGSYAVGAIPVDFSFNAIEVSASHPVANGRFRQTLVLSGLLVDIEGAVTCVAVDAATKRAWVGGVITANHSVNPSFLTPIHQVGRDVWFRVVDYGEGANAPQPDRVTFLGFEGGAGIITSAEYCATRPWPVNDARTNALTSGNIQVH
jgi:hypothetical protein